MAIKSVFRSALAFCTAAVLAAAVCGCDDLGEFEDTEEYYDSFGDVVLIESTEKERDSYSIERYFYNESSREDFLEGDDESYSGVPIDDYVYMAIPIEADMTVDSIALYIRGDSSAQQNIYLSVYLTDYIPEKWKAIGDPDKEIVEENGESVEKDVEYDDPDPATSLLDTVVRLDGDKWNSFIVETFSIDGAISKSINMSVDQYILIQFRNNSGVCVLDEATGTYVDPKTGSALDKASFTMTNLLVRALDSGREGKALEEG